MSRAIEANFDGLVGPTHHYGGLAYGNLASAAHAGQVSNPRAAALQGLAKMKLLADRGFAQAVLPPLERPDLRSLRRLGFSGTDAQMLAQVAQQAPHLLSRVASAASMWVANAATVSASSDTVDGKLHLTPANLNTSFHRAIEHPDTARVLRAVFPPGPHFVHHTVLPECPAFADEGAANHSRLCARHGAPGVGFFVFGRDAGAALPARYPARQTREASEAVARQHGLAPERCVFAQQHPAAIDAGVFHNDVIAVANENLLLFHEQAFADTAQVLAALRRALGEVPLRAHQVPATAVTLNAAVSSYLFNSQLLSRPDGGMLLLLPEDCRENAEVMRHLDELRAADIEEFLFADLRQSMRNGGGPACLRLRVVLNEAERAAVAPGVWLDDRLYDALCDWVNTHYRDRLAEADLADPALLEETRRALDTLSRLLGLGTLYAFQGAA